MNEQLIPPAKETRMTGSFRIPSSVRICANAVPPAALGDCVSALRAAGVKKIRPADGAEIVFIRDHKVTDPEGYELTIGKSGITLRFGEDAGAFYAVQTLAEILRAEGLRPACRFIEDRPVFRRRGVYLDCSRGKVPKTETLKELFVLFSSWKINEVQLYIENTFRFASDPDIGRGFDPFTPKEIRELSDFCKTRFIDFVPSLSSFGHMEKILMLPRYRKLGEKPGFNDLPGGTTLNPFHPGSLKLLEDLYADFLPCFDAVDFNICGDEPWELGKGASASEVRRKGLGRVYLDFILKLRTLCHKHGKRVNMWGDIVLNHPEIIPEIPKDIVMLNWDYDPASSNGRLTRHSAFTDAGLAAVCCSGTNGWNSHGSRIGMAMGNVRDFTAVGLKTGAEGILHTDWGDAGHRNTLAVSLASFSHAAGHAWNTKAMDDDTHLERFAFQVFGDRSGRLAADLRTLGHEDSGSWAYFALVESLKKQVQLGKFFGMGWPHAEKQTFSPRVIAGRIEALEGLDFTSFKGRDAFRSAMLEQYGLAARMDRLAWERLPLIRSVRKGVRPDRKSLLHHEEGYHAMAEEFRRIWLRTNKRSRLQDNLDAFDKAVREMSSLM
jgi:hypothetical protein